METPIFAFLLPELAVSLKRLLEHYIPNNESKHSDTENY
jgi:hypothetical protein